MTKQRWAALGALLVASAALGGCMTGPRTIDYAYYAVPCGTPGAVEARPLSDDLDYPGSNATPPAEQSAVPSAPSGVAPDVRSNAPTCVVPVSLARSSYRGARYPYGGGYYGSPYYGSFGLGFYGSSFGRSHGRFSHGFGHRAGAHHGRRH